MRMSFITLLSFLIYKAGAQNVGIGTTTPDTKALLHVHLANNVHKGILMTGDFDLNGSVPDLGSGSRFMFYPGKAAFRAGYANDTSWLNSKVGPASVAMGYATQATDYGATAFGYLTKANYMSFAAGYQTNATGYYSITAGGYTTASGFNSAAFGNRTKASGDASTAIGSQSSATGDISTAIGSHNHAKGSISTVIGSLSTASGDVSTTIGANLRAKGAGSVVVGCFNDSLLLNDEVGIQVPSPTTPTFVVGNGNSHTDRSNAFIVRKNGTVGVGNIIPEHRLDVDGRMRIRGGGNLNNTAGIWLNDVGNTAIEGFMGIYDNMNMGFYGATSGWGFLYNTTSGSAWLKGTLTQASDRRLKQNILPLSNSIQKLQRINGYHYQWLPTANADTSLQTGLLAQEIQAVFPELVKSDDNGTLSVNYTGIIPHLLEAVKDQQKEINELKQRLERFEKLLTNKQ